MDYHELTKNENLFQAWFEFRKGKRKRKDLQIFERYLEDNLFALQKSLKSKEYQHGEYLSFYVRDPKQRHIHKASVVDRVVHHLLYKYLYDLFDETFIYDSYSCRLHKGTHKAVDRLEKFTRKISRNYTRSCWALKCDIKKFFANIDHQILLHLLREKIKDQDVLWLISQVVNSFHSESGERKGIPLGNLTSQILANIYLNELDQFVKHDLKVKYYLRYADDFLFLSENKRYLKELIGPLTGFLKEHLKLKLHPHKILFRKLDWGVDFLGYIVLPHYCLPRTKTKQRIFKKLETKTKDLKAGKITRVFFNQALQSYLGFLGHACSYRISQQLRDHFSLLA